MLSATCHQICTLCRRVFGAVPLPLVAAVLAAVLLPGCGGSKHQRAAEPKSTSRIHSTRCVDGSFHRLGSGALAYAAIVSSHAVVARRPGGRALFRFGSLNVNGVPTVFSIRGALVDDGCVPRAYLVQVPKRPNGVTGWVAAGQVVVATVPTRIVIDLSARRVTLYRTGRKVLSATAAIGAAVTPTPTGNFYVNQRLVPRDPTGPFGPGAVGISAFSNVLTGWTQGGPIAIRGTNAPWSIGKAVSNGCIRLPNRVLRRLFGQAVAGTPVLIRQ
jgi:lipoprotein-anchoring transpeptidase ErfK/SrfK